ncbi:head GIN domain-containing protein [Seonamhaeicola sediminis]|nr:head GIN domain-containing protein [Seonamhaeicola sediminis]
MKKFNLIYVLTLIVFSSCSEDRFIGSGDTISEFRQTNNFNRISSEGTFEVTVTKGSTQSVQIIADDNIINRVQTNVVNGKLKLQLKEGNYSNVHLEAKITVTDLRGVSNSGVGNLYASGITDVDVFEIYNSGSASIYVDGNCRLIDVENEGSGSILAFDMLSESCKIDNTGSGEVEVSCESNLDVTIQGSGNVYYRGTPSININIEGSGSLIKD